MFSLNLSIMSFPKFVTMTKNTPFFFPILHVFAPLNDVHAYIAWSWKTALITLIFLRGWYPTLNASAPRRAYLWDDFLNPFIILVYYLAEVFFFLLLLEHIGDGSTALDLYIHHEYIWRLSFQNVHASHGEGLTRYIPIKYSRKGAQKGVKFCQHLMF